jgi:hypothetical protein
MSERLLPSPDDRAHQLVYGLRTTYPGVVEEWERQRTDAIASGEDGWLDFQTASGALWRLDAEVTIAQDFIEGDETGKERAIADYCTNAAEQLRIALRTQSPRQPEPMLELDAVTWIDYYLAHLIGAVACYERTGEDFYHMAIEAYVRTIKDVVRGANTSPPFRLPHT